jgi:hypothetical protein
MNTDHADAHAQSNIRYPEIGGCRFPVCGHTLAERGLDVSCHQALAAISRKTWRQLRRWPPSPAGALLTHLSAQESVHKLCKKAANLWAGRGKLGIVAAARAHASAASWANTIHALCIREKRALST